MFSLKNLKRLGVGAALVSALALSGFTTAAHADETTPTLPTSTITETTGDLTIHKHLQPSPASSTDTGGLPAGEAPANPISGVKFTVKQVTNTGTALDAPDAGKDINLKTNDGWTLANKLAEKYKALTSDTDRANFVKALTLSDAKNGAEDKTDANGIQKLTGIPVGLYYVEESDVSGAKLNNKDDVTLVKARPFFVSVPLTNPTNHNAWNYDVHVYPKNQQVTLDKTVTDAAKHVGDEIAYKISVPIPSLPENRDFEKFTITDPLPEQLTLANAKKAAAVSLEGATQAPNSLTDKTHYTLATENETVKVTFTAAGLAQLKAIRAANADAKVVVEFGAIVKTLDENTSAGTIVNVAYFSPSNDYLDVPNPDNPDDPKNPPSDKVKSKFGNVTFKKTKQDGTSFLGGAKFKVALCSDANKTALTVNGVSEWTSSATDGTFTIKGLHASDFVDGEEVTAPDKPKQYCLWETEAPAGYELLPEAIQFNVISATQTDDTKPIEINYGAVKNYPKNGGFDLPLTGSNALILVTAAGLCLVAGGAFLVLRRKEANKA